MQGATSSEKLLQEDSTRHHNPEHCNVENYKKTKTKARRIFIKNQKFNIVKQRLDKHLPSGTDSG
jgi:4-diphosphocytidyl-2C-methyl-D-erythritol kinase